MSTNPHLYIIHVSDYGFRGDAAYMYSFKGTLRELLEELCGITNENRDDDDGLGRKIGDYSNDELMEMVYCADDYDGGHYHDIFDVEADEQLFQKKGEVAAAGAHALPENSASTKVQNEREKGDDDGAEYGDPRDHSKGRE